MAGSAAEASTRIKMRFAEGLGVVERQVRGCKQLRLRCLSTARLQLRHRLARRLVGGVMVAARAQAPGAVAGAWPRSAARVGQVFSGGGERVRAE